MTTIEGIVCVKTGLRHKLGLQVEQDSHVKVTMNKDLNMYVYERAWSRWLM